MDVPKLISVIVLLFACNSFADAPQGYLFVSFDQGLEQAHRSKKNIFLYFGRYGCGWCDKTNTETFSQSKIKKLFTENYELVYVDAESGQRVTLPSGERITELELGARLNAYATPLFVYMTPGGKTLLRAPGFKTANDFINFDRYIQGKHYQTMTINEFLKTQ